MMRWIVEKPVCESGKQVHPESNRRPSNLRKCLLFHFPLLSRSLPLSIESSNRKMEDGESQMENSFKKGWLWMVLPSLCVCRANDDVMLLFVVQCSNVRTVYRTHCIAFECKKQEPKLNSCEKRKCYCIDPEWWTKMQTKRTRQRAKTEFW